MSDWMTCDRCDHNLEADIVRHLDEGGPDRCSHCGCALPDPPAAWLVANGYNAEAACLCGNPLDESADGDRCGECARQELEDAAFDAGEVL